MFRLEVHDDVRIGKVRYLGASTMAAWQFCKANYVAKLRGLTAFISMQPRYNLIMREVEKELLPLCADIGAGVLPYSPLARGRLTRPWEERKATVRGESDVLGNALYDETEIADELVADALKNVAERRGASRACVAVAWLLQKQVVTAPLLGVTNPEQLDDAAAAVTFHLDDDEIRTLEEPYIQREIARG